MCLCVFRNTSPLLPQTRIPTQKRQSRLFEMSVPPGGGPGTWVERGQGTLKLMKSTLTERTRMVMTKERPTNDRMDVLLNQIVHWEANLLAAQSDDGTSNRAFVFEAEDYANGWCPCLVRVISPSPSHHSRTHPHVCWLTHCQVTRNTQNIPSQITL